MEWGKKSLITAPVLVAFLASWKSCWYVLVRACACAPPTVIVRWSLGCGRLLLSAATVPVPGVPAPVACM